MTDITAPQTPLQAAPSAAQSSFVFQLDITAFGSRTISVRPHQAAHDMECNFYTPPFFRSYR
ncbi:MAG: hypothetical protein HY231_13195 [Acidobacteria bacterium]|nr:hypothetical protein [Acidobacteriota bacterium]